MSEVLAGSITAFGECAVRVELGTGIEESVFHRVAAFTEALQAHPFAGLIESVPAFTTVTVFYDPVRVAEACFFKKTPYHAVAAHLQHLLQTLQQAEHRPAETVEIPVCYGGAHGPDLEEVARLNGLTPDEVIEIHAGGEYLVYMIGFAPGFPYLGGLSDRIAAPRRAEPRLRIPVGSVGIAGQQTGVYPMETPGGWQLIGRTPLTLFRPDRNPPSLLQAGHIVRFRPITEREFAAWEEESR
ncbi:5-oxoprolinase subunit PxpB [Tumebacillus flagellatus]|uniref:Kinase inhibitor n=1 Tax=Tumebacillus flagellatus TaxID=1157490 RepID=A0A074LRG8_9BACL|nr:5-oxoprolinase subunit PxpB [Tumebacillus flagellatus]KEO84726.1 kinase inhibitor [Tumebacillus flagellatus]